MVSGYLTNAGFEVNYRSMDDGAQYEELLTMRGESAVPRITYLRGSSSS